MSKVLYPNQTESRRKNTPVRLYDLGYHAPLTRVMPAQRHSPAKGAVSAICRNLNVLSQAEALTAEAIDQARKRDALDVLLGIGTRLPGAVAPSKKSVVTAPAMGWKEVFLKQRLETRFDLPVIVDNKARAAPMYNSQDRKGGEQ